MRNLTESEKVSRIVQSLEDELNGDLFLRNLNNKVGRIKAIRKGFGSALGRPDAIAWVELDLHVLGVKSFLRVPILVEAEDAGIYAAKDDYEMFFEREKLNIPMIVVSKPGSQKLKKEYNAQANVRVTMHQIGIDRVLIE